jgi:hypothetical protein
MDGSWRTEEFKAYNLVPGAGALPAGGHIHPLLKAGPPLPPPPPSLRSTPLLLTSVMNTSRHVTHRVCRHVLQVS